MTKEPPRLENLHCAFESKRFSVYSGDERQEEQSFPRQVVVHPGAVVVLPLLDDNTVIMIRNRRFAVDETLWELPAGTLEPEEAPAATAERELIEETGYEAGSMAPLSRYYTTPGFCTEEMHAFVARNLTHVGQQLEASEKIEVKRLPYDKVLDMIRDGTIRDAKTIVTFLSYHCFFSL